MRTDIQALRALAVGLVVAFHLAPRALPGGYVGVDVFFVISGYLITMHLMREATLTGTIKVTDFWARRVRRLLPAALVVLAASLAGVYFLLPETVRSQNFIEVAFAAVYVLNWRLASDSVDYLAVDNLASVAQHYWSLSVEEQFYIVWPILILIGLWATAKFANTRRVNVVLVVLLAVFLLSLTFSIYETTRSQPSAYFITTTRSWEFAAGGLIAFCGRPRISAASYALLGWIGLAAIVVPAFVFNAGSAFPGWIALFPVGGTALLIYINEGENLWSPQYLASFGPTKFIGDNSYAIYLWHWPLIVVVTSLLGRAPGWIWGGAILVMTLVLAVLTKRFVEDPIRRAPKWLKFRLPTFALLGASTAAVLVLALVPVQIQKAQTAQFEAELDANREKFGCFGAQAVLDSCADPYKVTDSVNPNFSKTDTPGRFITDTEGCSGKKVSGQFEYDCTITRGSKFNVMLVGDSHAAAFFPGFEEAARHNNWSLSLHSRALCPGFGVSPPEVSMELKSRCSVWSEDLQKRLLKDTDVDVVVFAFRQSKYPDMSEDATKLFLKLADKGTPVAALRQVPEAGPGVLGPDCVEASGVRSSPCAFEKPQAETWLDNVAESTGTKLIDPREILCHDDICENLIGETIVYYDTNHLSATFSQSMSRWIEAELSDFETASADHA